MTQLSFCWSCAASGDGGPQSYSVEIVEAVNRIYGNINPLDSGVVYWTDTTVFPLMTNPVGGVPVTSYFLNALNPAGNTVRIKRGIGIVQGWLFLNDFDVDFDVSGGNANATDIIGLRRDLAAQTVRLFHGRGAAASTYALVQTPGTWEIPLVEVLLDGAGNFSALTDARNFAVTPFVPLHSHSSFQPVYLGTDQTAAAVMVANQSFVAPFSSGLTFLQNNDAWAQTFVSVPEDMVGGEVNFEWVFLASAGAGNAYIDLYYRLGSAAGGGAISVPVVVPVVASANIQTFNHYTIHGTTIACSPGEVLYLGFQRYGVNALDTFTNPFTLNGVRILYNKKPNSNRYAYLPVA